MLTGTENNLLGRISVSSAENFDPKTWDPRNKDIISITIIIIIIMSYLS